MKPKPTKPKAPPLSLLTVASRIDAHLKRIEADRTLNKAKRPGFSPRPFYYANCWSSGRFVFVIYVAFQAKANLSKADAEKYLQWLDAGHVGTHLDMP